MADSYYWPLLIMKIFIYFLFAANLAWYLSRAVTLALNLAPGVTPDEMFHLQVIDLYRRSPNLFPFTESWTSVPRPSPEFRNFGGTTEYAYLYHLALGKLAAVLSLDVFQFRNIVSLRFTGILLSLLSLFAAYRFFKATNLKTPHALIGVMIATNIPSFTFVASGVGYDNLLYLFSWISLYYFIRFAKTLSIKHALKLTIFTELAMLTKFSALPFALLLSAGALILPFIRRKTCTRSGTWMLYVLLGFLTLLNLELYGGNLYQYGKIIPTSEEVFSGHSEANYSQTVDVETIIQNQDKPRLGRIAYLVHWSVRMVERSLGLKGHKLIELPLEVSILVLLIMLGASVVFCINIDVKDFGLGILFVCAVCYALFLAFFHNYPEVDLGINGRYMFLFLPVLIAVVLKGLLKNRSETSLRSSLLVYMVFFSIQFQVLYYDETFSWLLSPPSEDFYYIAGYFPNPIYDENYSIISDNRNSP